MNINILLINALIYVITFIYFFKKMGVTIYSVLWFEFAIIAFLGYYTFETGIYQGRLGNQNINSLTPLPYLFVFVGYIIAFEPFRKLNPNLDTPIPYRKYTNLLLNLWIVVMTAYLILKISEATITMAYGMGDYYGERSEEGYTLFDYSDNILLKRLNTFGDLLSTPLIPFIIAYCVQCWKRKEHTIQTLILATLCFLPYIFQSVAGGSRNGLFTVFLNILFFYLFYRQQLTAKVKRVASVIAAVFIGLGLFYSLLITTERFSNRYDNNLEPILSYFGEPFPNVGFYYYDKLKDHTWGERRFPWAVGAKKFDSANDRRRHWEKKTRTNMFIFTTYWGDMYIEFGTVGAFIFIIVYTLLIKRLTWPRVTIYNMSYLYFYFRQMSSSFRCLDWVTSIGFVYMVVAMILVNYCIKKWYFTPSNSH